MNSGNLMPSILIKNIFILEGAALLLKLDTIAPLIFRISSSNNKRFVQ